MGNRFLLPYYPLVDFLADFFGNTTEVVLHDFSDLEHSVVKIRNGYISGRFEGGPATDFVMRKLRNKGSEPYVCNYKGVSKNSQALKSGSFYIRDDHGFIIGMLCLNTNVENLLATQAFLDAFLGGSTNKIMEEIPTESNENLGQSINEIIDSSIKRALDNFGGTSESLTTAQREVVVSKMDSEGVFLFKGAITKAAEALGISESSLYRYLKKVRLKTENPLERY